MSNKTERNSARIKRIADFLYAENIAIPDIVRLLNFSFSDHTYIAVNDLVSPKIERADHGHYIKPNLTIWSPK